MIQKVVLIGMRGCGKSHFGTCLSRELGWAKLDTDDEIEIETGKTVAKLIQDEGWEVFRDKEHEVCKSTTDFEKVVISTGGGAITFERNREYLKKNALVVFLFSSMKDLLKRLDKDTTRPSLTGKSSLQEEMETVWAERKDIYFAHSDIVFRAQPGLSKHRRINVEKNARVLAQKIKTML